VGAQRQNLAERFVVQLRWLKLIVTRFFWWLAAAQTRRVARSTHPVWHAAASASAAAASNVLVQITARPLSPKRRLHSAALALAHHRLHTAFVPHFQQAVDDASLGQLYGVLREHVEASRRLQDVLRQDALDLEVLKREAGAPGGVGVGGGGNGGNGGGGQGDAMRV